MKTKSGASWPQLWKRNAVVAVIGLFVCAAVYLNWNYEQEVSVDKTLGESTMVSGSGDPLLSQSTSGTGEETGGTPQELSGTGYFAAARLNRQQARDSALSLLQDAAGQAETDPAMQEEANETIQAMADYTVTEAQIENLVLAKGYTDCVAYMSAEGISVAVAAPEGGLKDADVAVIADIVLAQSDYSLDDIRVVEVQ